MQKGPTVRKSQKIPALCSPAPFIGGIDMYGNQLSGYPFIGAQMGQNNPFLPPVPAPAPVQQTGPAVLYAPSAKEFGNVSVQPGRQALVISQNDPFIAFKSANQMGMVQTTIYRLEPVTAEQIDGPAVEYATKTELARVEGVVQQLIDAMNKPTTRQTKKEAATE